MSAKETKRVKKPTTVFKPKCDKIDVIMRLHNSCTLNELIALENHVKAMRRK